MKILKIITSKVKGTRKGGGDIRTNGIQETQNLQQVVEHQLQMMAHLILYSLEQRLRLKLLVLLQKWSAR